MGFTVNPLWFTRPVHGFQKKDSYFWFLLDPIGGKIPKKKLVPVVTHKF